MDQQTAANVASALVIANFFPTVSKDAGGAFHVAVDLSAQPLDANTVGQFATQQSVTGFVSSVDFT